MRRVVLWIVLLAELGALVWLIARESNPATAGHDDFISSWAAGRLNAFGHDPYDASLVMDLQRTVGWTESIPYRIWYPPWAMALLAPFGVLSYQTGRIVWWVFNIGAIVLSADLLWRYFGGDRRLRLLSWMIALTFWPAVADLATGQVSAFLILGLAGFLHFERSDRPIAAGACLPMATIKPTVLHLFWIALLFWVLRERRWRVAAGAVGAGAALLGIALALNPDVVGHFLHMVATDAPRQMASTLGALMRKGSIAFTGHDRWWLQFAPSVVGLVWLLVWWRRFGGAWDWREQIPTVVIASVVSTSYGWIYDDVVLLVPLMGVAVALVAQRPHPATAVVLAAYLLFDGAILVMNVAKVNPFLYVWVPVGFLAWYWLAVRRGVVDWPPVRTTP